MCSTARRADSVRPWSCALRADPDELFRRIEQRDLEGRWGARSITRAELDAWSEIYEVPTPEELATYDTP